jgi:polyhydroxybutyrate depolymerase
VIDFHGWTSNAGSQRSSSGFDELAELEGFVVVWPEGYESSFNAGRLCCAPANEDGIDDVDFTRLLVSVVSEAHEIDLDRVYVTGLSNGCAMAQRVAADASDLVAAVACMSLYLLDDADPGYTPVPVMELHGTNDGVVAYEPSAFFAGAEENWSYWAELNGCTGDPAETWRSDASAARTYQTCAGGSEVSLVTIDRGGHVLYAGVGTDIDTARLAWDFMRRFEIGT